MRQGLSRRHLLGCGCGLGAGMIAAAAHPTRAFAAGPSSRKTDMSPDQALQALKDGNAKFLADTPAPMTAQSRDRRIEIALGQTPFCVLVSCSDSRVSPEILFGRGLGELFIVRNAGNTVDTTALGSIEYAVAVLGVPLILVMGHSRCGAVEAAVKVVKENAVFPGAIGQMVEPIVPAVLTAQAKIAQAKIAQAKIAQVQGGDLVEASVRANVDRTVACLRNAAEPMLTDPQKAGKLKVVGAAYSLDHGNVDFFNEA